MTSVPDLADIRLMWWPLCCQGTVQYLTCVIDVFRLKFNPCGRISVDNELPIYGDLSAHKYSSTVLENPPRRQ